MPSGNASRATWPAALDPRADRVRAPRAPTPPPCAAGRCPARRCCSTSRSRRLAAAVPQPGDSRSPSTPSGSGSARASRRRAHLARAPSRPPTPAPASSPTGGPRTRARARISAAVSAALPAASGTPEASRSATTTICRPVSPGPAAEHVHQLAAVALEAVDLDREAAVAEGLRHQPGRAAVAQACRRGGPARRPRSAAPGVAAWRPRTPRRPADPAAAAAGVLSSENITSTTARTRRARTPPGRSAARSRPATYNLDRRPSGTPQCHAGPPHPPGRRRAVGAEAAGASRCARTATTSCPRWTAARRSTGLRDQRFDLVVLDLMLPQVNGLEVCRRLRAASSVPIIMLTARDEESDKVLGLELGRRRLHHQALLGARVPQPREGGAAPGRAGRGRGAQRGADRGRRPADRLREAHRDPRRRGRRADLRGVRDPRRACPQPGPRLQPDGAARAGVGRRRPTATRARWTCTSATCARSSSTTPGAPS